MKSPIERAARALCERDGFDPDKLVGPPGFQNSVPRKPGRPQWERYVGHVRAVIEAIRVPSEAMKLAAGAEPIDFRFDRFSSTEMRNDEMWQRGYADTAYLWSTMIDAALQEG